MRSRKSLIFLIAAISILLLWTSSASAGSDTALPVDTLNQDQVDILDRVIQITQLFALIILGLFAAFAGALVWLTRISSIRLSNLIPRETVEKAFEFAQSIARLTPSEQDDAALAKLREEFISELYEAVDQAVNKALQSAADADIEA